MLYPFDLRAHGVSTMACRHHKKRRPSGLLGRADTQGLFVVPPSNDVRLVHIHSAIIVILGCATDHRLQSALGVVAACLILDSFVRQRTVPQASPTIFALQIRHFARNPSGTRNAARSSDFDGEVSKHEENGACAASSRGVSGGGRS